MTKPGGDRRYMTVLFADMRGFTSLSERLSPDALVTLLNVYLEDMSVPIQETDGVIDKFIGDAIMAYWGPPFVDATHQAQNACTAALRQLNLIAAFQKKVPEILGVRIDGDPIDIHSGIASGPALVGTVGSAHHRNYTIMGDTVNLAARIEGACKAYGVRLLVDEATRKDTKGILFREIDALRVKGRGEPVKVFEAMTFDPAPETTQRLARSFENGLSAYRKGSLAEAGSAFQKCLEIAPNDGPARVFMDRLERLNKTPPPSDWEGVFELQGK
ncbi:MAG: adenylate/guanylate cyclase domain-containing protein [Alphaproteobacteria bacterium]|nr:adenylate/guanylate cyclase domain-containing protein [Alphaproteobacteria bacterium]